METELNPTPLTQENRHLKSPLQPAFRIAGGWNGKAVHRIPKFGQLEMTVIDASRVLITVM
jgi:hypothetical protein